MLSLARSHKLAPRKRHVLPSNFWDKVDRSGGEDACWEWLAYRSSGYGKFSRRRGETYYAHRVVLQFFTQREGEGLEAAHGPCHRRHCVNPKHLSWKTHKENAADMLRDGTSPRGERQGRNKLTEAQVLAIRADPRPQPQIAADYGISSPHVSGIKSRRFWGWLE